MTRATLEEQVAALEKRVGDLPWYNGAMPRATGQILSTTAFVGMSVFGHRWGGRTGYGTCSIIVILTSFTGVVLLAIDCRFGWRTRPTWRSTVALGLAAYAAALFFGNAPLLPNYDDDWGFPFVALLIPLVLAGVACPRRDEWLTTAGVFLFLAGSTAALGYNSRHGASGIGYWLAWIY